MPRWDDEPPVSLYEFLVKLIADLCEGQSVAIVQNDPQLTTVEGARMLGVSRQFLIKLLERGDIPHHMVGTHRRIYVRDLLAYKAKRDSNRRKILDDLNQYIAVLDTCVLAPLPLCDILLRLAEDPANVTGCEYLVGAMTNDPKDRHVLAAAVR
jgi:excisionase family DNA binding protein